MGIYTKDVQSHYKDLCSTMLIVASFVIARILNHSRCPSTEESIKKMLYTHAVKYYSEVKIKMTFEICMQMDRSGRKHTEWGKPEPKKMN